MRLLLVTAAVAALAGPALAQDAAQTAPSPAPVPVEGQAAAPAPTESSAEAALEAKGDVFGERMEAMAAEMQAAYTAAAGDQAKAEADTTAIADRYRPEATAFAAEVRDFITTQAAGVPEDQRAQVTVGAEQAYQAIGGIPDQIRQKVLAGEPVSGAEAE